MLVLIEAAVEEEEYGQVLKYLKGLKQEGMRNLDKQAGSVHDDNESVVIVIAVCC